MGNELITIENELTASSTKLDKGRIELYQQLVDVVLEVMKLGKQLKPNSNQAQRLGRRIQGIGLKMMAISTDDVVQSFVKWRTVSSAGEDPAQVIQTFCELLMSIRKEMLPDTKRTIDDVLDIMT